MQTESILTFVDTKVITGISIATIQKELIERGEKDCSCRVVVKQ